MSTTGAEILLELDRSRPRGLRAQVEEELRAAIRSGRLGPGTSLPSTRALAADLGITRGVIVAAYDQLLAEGYLLSRPGSGTVVNATPEAVSARGPKPSAGASVMVDFRPGVPDLDLFPRAAWMRATRSALQTMPSEQLGYIDSRGLPQLRAALVDYLARVRGVCTDPDCVVICNGFAHGFGLVAKALRETGRDVVAVEDPGHDGPRGEITWSGGSYRGIAVDDDGIVVDELRRSRARVAVVTPAHQMPTGAVLSASRRSALAAWARDVDGYVIEDDYDAEYRYDRHPVGALQGVAPDRVIYCGTLSKSLAPGLRLGWLVLPHELVEPIITRRRANDSATASIAQAAYAKFVSTGDLDRHLRRTRRIYRQRRDALVAALARWLPDATPGGIAAGLTILVTLPHDVREAVVEERALAAGVRVYPLGSYRTKRDDAMSPGLVLGYGQLSPAKIEQGVRLLAEAVSGARR
ncbi:MAG: GntR family transcriptional regulator / MocR family aminotransferase [Acidimicrobiaceae bacterium]|nr:GntR family transcriptional regulator / MocR family aminotransferase [Acidimicrobiaceae bacterium]